MRMISGYAVIAREGNDRGNLVVVEGLLGLPRRYAPRNDVGEDEVLVRLLRCGGALPNKRTNGGLLLSLLKDKYRVKRHACSQ